MGHELKPRSGGLLTAAEIVQRLRGEFAHVHVDAGEGTQRAVALADWIEHAEWLERAKRLRSLEPGEALGVTFGDDPSGPTLHACALPGDVIKFGYASADEEEHLRPLVDRCARALDSDVVPF